MYHIGLGWSLLHTASISHEFYHFFIFYLLPSLPTYGHEGRRVEEKSIRKDKILSFLQKNNGLLNPIPINIISDALEEAGLLERAEDWLNQQGQYYYIQSNAKHNTRHLFLDDRLS